MNKEIRKDTDKLEILLDETLQRFKEYNEAKQNKLLDEKSYSIKFHDIIQQKNHFTDQMKKYVDKYKN